MDNRHSLRSVLGAVGAHALVIGVAIGGGTPSHSESPAPRDEIVDWITSPSWAPSALQSGSQAPVAPRDALATLDLTGIPENLPAPSIDFSRPAAREWLGTPASPWAGQGDLRVVPSDAYMADSPEILAARPPAYPEWVRRAGIAGRVIIEVVVDSSGRPDTASMAVVFSDHRALEPAARDYVRHARFRPGRVNGRAVSVRVRVPIDFELR